MRAIGLAVILFGCTIVYLAYKDKMGEALTALLAPPQTPAPVAPDKKGVPTTSDGTRYKDIPNGLPAPAGPLKDANGGTKT